MQEGVPWALSSPGPSAVAWAGATFVVLAVQCARSARGDAMLDHIKETIEAKAKRDAARNAV